ncbi:MAG: hypothetical protein J0G34_00825 [Afipia sp.]|nr:hypothetical protein [Afipia sp.]
MPEAAVAGAMIVLLFAGAKEKARHLPGFRELVFSGTLRSIRRLLAMT